MSKLPAIFHPVPGSGAERAEQLRRQYPRFVYERFSLDRSADTLRVTFHFRIGPDIAFAPETTFLGVDWPRVDSLPQGALENLLFHLGLIETLSYWKATCSPEIRVEAGQPDPQQIAWFLDLLRHGMGEFFYVNQIDWRAPEFVRVVTPPSRRPEELARTPALQGRDLVLVSGGKDSVVTLELLSAAGRPFDCLLLNPTEAALAVAGRALLHQGSGGHALRSSKSGGRLIIVRRTIDPLLLELNAAGYLNGHTPFSALLAVLGVTAAAIYGYNRVIVSNERSAEEAGVEYLGEQINHQYSKTLRFETTLREYCRQYLVPTEKQILRSAQDDTPSVDYFSLLRPLYELQIARLFAQHPAYFPLFRSCNRGMKSNAWCGRCSKCLFVYTALYPFLEREQMFAIFGSDLFAWDGAGEVLRALLGLDAHKPFECVGTREETLAAIYLGVENYTQQGIPLPRALREIEETILAPRRDLPELARSILTAWSDQHHLPPKLAELLQKKII